MRFYVSMDRVDRDGRFPFFSSLSLFVKRFFSFLHSHMCFVTLRYAADRMTNCDVSLLDKESKSSGSKAVFCRFRKYWSKHSGVSLVCHLDAKKKTVAMN